MLRRTLFSAHTLLRKPWSRAADRFQSIDGVFDLLRAILVCNVLSAGFSMSQAVTSSGRLPHALNQWPIADQYYNRHESASLDKQSPWSSIAMAASAFRVRFQEKKALWAHGNFIRNYVVDPNVWQASQNETRVIFFSDMQIIFMNTQLQRLHQHHIITENIMCRAIYNNYYCLQGRQYLS
jgi:hypothetical protein